MATAAFPWASKPGVDVAVDFGSSWLRATRPTGRVLEEPSMVARSPRGQFVAFGARARELHGRASHGLDVIRPVQGGVVVDFVGAEAMLRRALTRLGGRARPRVLVAVPPHLNEIERRAVQESVRRAGARDVLLAPAPVLAALGAELDVGEPRGHLVVDVGGGRSTCAVVSLAGLVVHHTEAVGGIAMDAAVTEWMRRTHGLILGRRSAEALKQTHAAADGGAVRIVVRGRDLTSGGPREVAVSGDELAEALHTLVGHIRRTVLQTLAVTPPELSSDIMETGAILTGGAGQLRGLDRVLRDATDLPFLTVDEPSNAVVRGARRALSDTALLERLTQ